MKKILGILLVIICMSCNGEKVPDCFQNSGDVIQKEFFVADFTKITVFENVELILSQGPEHKVIVATGEYLMNDVAVQVEGDRLKLYDNNGCNLTRDYGITKAYVTAPNIEEIRSSTGLPIQSQGVLNYDTLRLLSEDYTTPEAVTRDGVFNLEVNSTSINVTVNALSTITLSGFTENLNVSYVSGDARFEGRYLIANNVTLGHRGTNDIIVNPQNKLKATLRSTGDVISLNYPPELDIQELYTGRVIFE